MTSQISTILMNTEYTLLIVEDDKTTREGLRDCIEWKDYGIKLVDAVRNGEEALDILVTEKVDILITDIRMPKLDGLELIAVLREKNEEIKIIIISAFWEKKYIKSAFQFNVIGYLLKPIDLSELDKMLKKAISRIDNESTYKMDVNDLTNRLSSALPAMREKIFYELLHGKNRSAEWVEQQIHLCELDFVLNDWYFVLVCPIPNAILHSAGNMVKKNELLLIEAKRQIINRLCEFYHIFCLNSENEINIIISDVQEIEYEHMLQIGSQIARIFITVLNQPFSPGIGSCVSAITNLSESYNQAKYSAAFSGFFAAKSVVHYADIPKVNKEYSAVSLDVFQNAFIKSIWKSDKNLLESTKEKFIHEIRKTKITNINIIRNLCLQTILLLSNNFSTREPVNFERFVKFGNFDDLIGEVYKYIEKLFETFQEENRENTSSIVERVKKLIRQKYNQKLTIKSIAEELYFTPNYISLLFKKYTGKTVVEFITNVRMDTAIGFLLKTTMKVYEVGDAVGYSNHEYFCRLFKQYTGYTPSKYREKYLYE